MQRHTRKPDMVMRPIALLDIDLTTYFGADPAEQDIENYNLKLFAALKEKGIKDILLFSDMILEERLIRGRQKIIACLQEQGFIVHGIGTPVDFAWNIDDKILGHFYDCFIQLEISLKKGHEKNLANLDLLLEEFPTIQNLISDKNLPPLDVAFKEAEKKLAIEDSQKRGMFQNVTAKSYQAKLIIDIASFKRNIPHSKGIMLEQFFANKPTWVNSCVVCDDNPDCIEAVNMASPKIKFTVNPILVSTNNDDSLDYYRQKLGTSIAEKVIADTDNQIKTLKRGFNPFKRTCIYKVDALERLKEAVRDPKNKGKTIEDIIFSWQMGTGYINRGRRIRVDYISDIIDDHRNIFHRADDSDTKTRLFVSSLLKKYGNLEPTALLSNSKPSKQPSI